MTILSNTSPLENTTFGVQTYLHAVLIIIAPFQIRPVTCKSCEFYKLLPLSLYVHFYKKVTHLQIFINIIEKNVLCLDILQLK